jgi:branched-chain amino acid transport system substrate-binding protein
LTGEYDCHSIGSIVTKIFRLFCAAAGFVLLVSGSIVPARAAEPFVIPVVTPLTGGYAYSGAALRASLLALEAQVNKEGGIKGQPLKFDFIDDQSSPQTAVQVVQNALNSKPQVIIGSEFAALCLAMEPFTRGKAVQYCVSPGVHPQYGADMFSASISTQGMATAMLRYMREKGWKRVGTITSTDASGQDAENQLKVAAALPENVAAGLSIVDAEHFNPTDQTVAAQMAKIKAANPDVLVMWTSGQPFGTVTHAYIDAGLTIPAFTTNANMSFTFMKQFAGFLPKDLYFPGLAYLAGPNSKEAMPAARAPIKRMYDAMKAAGTPVDFQAGIPWDPAQIVVDAYRKLGTSATYEQVRQYILGLKGYAGISGIYDFSDRGAGVQRGLTSKDVLLMRWDPAKTAFNPASTLGGGVP